MAIVLEEGRYTGEFILSEARGMRSREQITVAAGQNLAPGTVVGALTASGLVSAWDPGNTDGTEDVAGILYAAVNATDADTAGVIIARDAEVAGEALAYFDGASADDKDTAAAALADLNIRVRY